MTLIIADLMVHGARTTMTDFNYGLSVLIVLIAMGLVLAEFEY